MGFAVTATHLVFAIALLGAGTFATATYWRVNDDIEDARRAQALAAEERAHTALAITGAPTHDSGASTLDITIKNTGVIVLDIDAFTYLVDGALNGEVAAGYPQVAGAAATDLLLPGETMTIRLEGVTSAPANVAAVAGNGVAAYWTA